VISVDGARAARATATGSAANAEAIGVNVAEQLLERGADEILADVQRAQAAVEGIQP
jgi:hydroxymethylbilane synthase